MQNIAIDLGYGFVKGISESGRSILFPTQIGPGHDRSLNELFGQNRDLMSQLHLRVQNEEYFIGDLARESATVSRIFEQERYNHPYTRVLFAAAIGLLADHHSVNLVTGLPLDFYQAQAKAFRQSLLGMGPEIEWLAGPLGGVKQRINVQQSFIFPQGAGAVFAALLNEQGQFVYPELMMEGTMIGLIDSGFRTTDYIVVEMQKGNTFAPKAEQSGTIDEGVVELHRMARQSFKDQTGGADLDDDRVQRALKTGALHYRGKSISVEKAINAGIRSIAANVADRLKVAWGKDADLLDAIFVCGGGKELFFDSLQDSFDNRLTPIPDGQFANALGYLRLGKMVFGAQETSSNLGGEQR